MPVCEITRVAFTRKMAGVRKDISQMLSEEEKQLLKEAHCLFGTFDRLFLQHKASIYSLCFQFLRNQTDAEDATHETFVKARLNIASFRGEATFHTWLWKIAESQCYNMLRARRSKLNQNTTSFDQSPIPDVEDNNVSSVEDIVLKPISAQQLITDILARAANKWKVFDYQLFILRTLPSKTTSDSNMTYPEISMLLEKNENTLRGRWRDQIKPVLDEMHKEEEAMFGEK